MPVDVTLEMNILPYLRTMQLIDVGDFVKNSSSMVSAKYHFVFNFIYIVLKVTTGVLIACGRLMDHNGESSSDACMIRELQTHSV